RNNCSPATSDRRQSAASLPLRCCGSRRDTCKDTAIFLVISLHTTTPEGRRCSRQFHLAGLMPHKSEQRGMLDCIAVRRSFLKPYLPTRLENRCPIGTLSKRLCMLHR